MDSEETKRQRDIPEPFLSKQRRIGEEGETPTGRSRLGQVTAVPLPHILWAIPCVVLLAIAIGSGGNQPPIISDLAGLSAPCRDSRMIALAAPAAPSTLFAFARHYVDTSYGGNGKPGWVRAGDMDNDGDLDLVAGGGYALFIYENDGNAGGWTRYGNLDATGQIGANGAVLYDVDGDTYLDVVCAKYQSDLGWWENPGGSINNTPWAFHKLADESYYLHDLMRADLDQDGTAEEFVANLNQGYWNSNITVKWFRPGVDPTQLWETHTVEAGRNEGTPHGHAGLNAGDIDQDTHVDIAYSNGWYEAPDAPDGSWTWHQVTTIYGVSNSLLRDMDTDGDLDLVVSAGHHGAGVYWFAAPDHPITEAWTQHEINSQILNPECLAALDLDWDSDLDVVSCDLDFDKWNQEVHNVYVFENTGSSASWNQQNVAPNSYPSHLLQTIDIDEDGDRDIISESAGYSVVSFYENTTGWWRIYLPLILRRG